MELKTKWLKALRSGNYKQGKSNLCSVNPATGELSYCCLGVLCEVAGIQKTLGHSNSFNFNFPEKPERTTISTSLAIQLDLSRKDINSLMYLNDTANRDFDVIANHIEWHDFPPSPNEKPESLDTV